MKTESDLIVLDHVSYSHSTVDGNKTVIRNISLTIHQGEWITIVGTNGSGKSTLAKIIAKIYNVSTGNVTYRIPAQPAIQLIFQNPETQLIGETVYDDVCFGMENYGVHPSQMQTRALAALRKVGLSVAMDTPTNQLSGGQKQLLAIAGCLAVNPSVFIFDEATSMLDPMSRDNILRISQELLSEGKTIIWITQLLDELAWADRVVAMENGTMVFTGTKKQFFYGSLEHNSVCEQLGFIPPYTIQVAHCLLKQGYHLNPLPVSPAELGKAVGDLI